MRGSLLARMREIPCLCAYHNKMSGDDISNEMAQAATAISGCGETCSSRRDQDVLRALGVVGRQGKERTSPDLELHQAGVPEALRVPSLSNHNRTSFSSLLKW